MRVSSFVDSMGRTACLVEDATVRPYSTVNPIALGGDRSEPGAGFDAHGELTVLSKASRSGSSGSTAFSAIAAPWHREGWSTHPNATLTASTDNMMSTIEATGSAQIVS